MLGSPTARKPVSWWKLSPASFSMTCSWLTMKLPCNMNLPVARMVGLIARYLPPDGFNDQLAGKRWSWPITLHKFRRVEPRLKWLNFLYLQVSLDLTSSDILRLDSRRLQQCLILLDGEIRQVCPDFVWIRNAVDPSEIICLRLSHWANDPTSQLLHSKEPHLDRFLPKRTILFDFCKIYDCCLQKTSPRCEIGSKQAKGLPSS